MHFGVLYKYTRHLLRELEHFLWVKTFPEALSGIFKNHALAININVVLSSLTFPSSAFAKLMQGWLKKSSPNLLCGLLSGKERLRSASALRSFSQVEALFSSGCEPFKSDLLSPLFTSLPDAAVSPKANIFRFLPAITLVCTYKMCVWESRTTKYLNLQRKLIRFTPVYFMFCLVFRLAKLARRKWRTVLLFLKGPPTVSSMSRLGL